MIVAVFLVIACILMGVRGSFGVFFKSLEAEFELTRAATSSIFSTYMLLVAAFAVITGWAVDRYGPKLLICFLGLFTGLSLLITSQANSFWQTFLSYSLLLALGTGGVMPVIVTVLSRWFRRKRGFAIGIATSGVGLGSVVISPFAAYLISNLGWRMSFVVIGLIALLVVIPLAMLMKRNPREIGVLPDGEKSGADRTELSSEEDAKGPVGLSLTQALRTRSFWLLLFALSLFASCMMLILVHVVPYATDVGIPAIEASAILSFIGGFFIVSRLLAGRISDITGRKIPIMVCLVSGAAAMVWLIYARDLWTFYLFGAVFGLAWGGAGVNILTLSSDIFGGRNIGAIVGILECGACIAQALGSYIGGLIFDLTGSYAVAFGLGAAVFAVSTLLIALTRQEAIGEVSLQG